MRRLVSVFLILFIAVSFCGCNNTQNKSKTGTEITDCLGNVCYVGQDARVVSCYASFADCWLLSGGRLAGVTKDAVDEHNLDIGEAEIIGTVKHIDMEKVAQINPDYVILSADLTAHLALKDSLDALNIQYGYFKQDTFEDYKSIMLKFCNVNNRADLYEKNVAKVEKQIYDIKSKLSETQHSFLLMRAFSTGMKAKTDDNPAGIILKEFSLLNIADSNKTMLEDLSMEHIVKTNPDYIFVMTMGAEDGAVSYLENNVKNHIAFRDLDAVKNDKFFMLPKDLFHYKPNERWGESYEYIAKLILPEIFGR